VAAKKGSILLHTMRGKMKPRQEIGVGGAIESSWGVVISSGRREGLVAKLKKLILTLNETFWGGRDWNGAVINQQEKKRGSGHLGLGKKKAFWKATSTCS